MGWVQKFAAKKHLRVLREAEAANPGDLAEARQRIAEAGPSVLPDLLALAAEGVDNGALEEAISGFLDDATVPRILAALRRAEGRSADLLERVLSHGPHFDPQVLLEEIEAGGAARPRLERILRVRGKHMPDGVLRSLLGEGTRDRVRVVLGMVEGRGDAPVVALLLSLLGSKDAWVRVHALRALRARAAEESGDAVAALLADKDPVVRREATQALGAIRSSKYLAPLCHALRDSDLQVSASAIEALTAIGDPGAVRHLIEVLKDESEYARRAAVEVLNEVATPEAIQDLVQALQDEDWWVRVRAADALGALGGERVVDAILSLVRSEDVFVRRYAIEILNSIPSERSVPALIGALDDSDWWVRERAIDALGKTGDPRAVEPLAAELRDNAELATLVLAALGKIGEQQALSALVEFVGSDVPAVRDLTGKTLRDLAKTARDAEVRKGAARALNQQGEGSEWGRAQGRGGAAQADPGHPARPRSGPQDARSGIFQAVGATRIEPMLPELGLDPREGGTGRGAGATPPPQSLEDRGASTPPGSWTPPPGAGGRVSGVGPDGATQRMAMNAGNETDGGRLASPSGSFTPTGATGFGGPAAGGISLLDYPRLPTGTLLLDRYTVVRKIGEGGFGYVYLVMDGSVGEEIILKILSPHISLDETMIKRFVHELKYNRRIVHPNVIRLYDFLELHPGHAISMEYFRSEDLGNVLHREKRIDPERLVRMTEQICVGLKAAHDSGIVHRDIKPANVLVGDDDRVKIVDFGLAAASDTAQSRVTKSGILVGTPQYMAPEQIRGTQVDHRTDIYALGALLYECLTGAPPFTSDNPVNTLMMHLTDPVPALRGKAPEVPEALAAIVERSLAKAPEDRPQSIDDLLAGLGRLAA